MSETAGRANRLGERLGFDDFDAFVFCDHKLRNTRTTLEADGMLSMIDHDDLDFAAVIGIDRPWRIKTSHAMLQCESRAGPNLSFAAFGDFDRKTRRHKRYNSGIEREAIGASKVHSGTMKRGVRGKRNVADIFAEAFEKERLHRA